ncbi:class I SAM-dependent methyltransferase [Thalassotalea profundi]|uniref:SAM-dependent methyltransferase n=1 Tax=Thalassotalea profundi TaxID=2036687 RepID=A0ABQ3ID84_9GAMM|nr:class I SAM-dependent methyltransferase [Thalassotalea profundi]GHE79278.1 SAM-dependent methyltransferase [Thalassotalea profundi]
MIAIEKMIEDHYTHGNLLKTIELALSQFDAKTDKELLRFLSAIDEFHIGGSEATMNLIKQAALSANSLLLDIGCGLGGTARYLARQFDSQVVGIDLTAEYLSVGKMVNQKLNLASQINLIQASALNLPFLDNTFDGITMLHVGMNIADKKQLFSEIYRCLRKGATFLLYDVMQVNQDKIIYPLPWASTVDNSFVSTLDTYIHILLEQGFEHLRINDRREFSLKFFNEQAIKRKQQGNKPQLSLQTLFKDNAKINFINLINQINSNALAPIEIIAMKKN